MHKRLSHVYICVYNVYINLNVKNLSLILVTIFFFNIVSHTIRFIYILHNIVKLMKIIFKNLKFSLIDQVEKIIIKMFTTFF